MHRPTSGRGPGNRGFGSGAKESRTPDLFVANEQRAAIAALLTPQPPAVSKAPTPECLDDRLPWERKKGKGTPLERVHNTERVWATILSRGDSATTSAGRTSRRRAPCRH